ncbi:MAG: LysM peptidoglycan-binding domain-containing protein [Polyangia bacterium]
MVEKGDSIAEIARLCGVGQRALLEANGLDKESVIRPGDVLRIPEVLLNGWTESHVVEKGDTLCRIARRYGVDLGELRRLNRIDADDRLEIGRRLVIPKGKRVDPSAVAAGGEDGENGRDGAEQPWDGKMTVVRVRDAERETMTVFDRRGRVRRYARRTISRLARSKRGRVRLLHPRLIRLLGKVAQSFPGHEIEIVSGYRPPRRSHRSQHTKGRAIDFRVRGVSNSTLFRLIRGFSKVGAGYYPNSTFVHLDVRERKYLWIDVSGPGEPARYAEVDESALEAEEDDPIEKAGRAPASDRTEAEDDEREDDSRQRPRNSTGWQGVAGRRPRGIVPPP